MYQDDGPFHRRPEYADHHRDEYIDHYVDDRVDRRMANYYYAPPRKRKGYWVGFLLGLFLTPLIGILIAWAIQSGVDRERYIPRYVIGSIHGVIFPVVALVILLLLFAAGA